MSVVITVDGPSGAGKGTLCKLLAEHTGFALLDSGALYRIIALAAMTEGVPLDSAESLGQLASNLDVAFRPAENGVTVLLGGLDVSSAIRREEVGMGASKVAPIPQVRAALLQRQRDFAQSDSGLVADGRDMGTVVFPDAQVKLFLTASAAERASRRVAQLEVAGETADYKRILADIEARDKRDTERATSPLRPADDALLLDSTEMSIDQVFEVAMARVQAVRGS